MCRFWEGPVGVRCVSDAMLNGLALFAGVRGGFEDIAEGREERQRRKSIKRADDGGGNGTRRDAGQST